MDVWFSRLQDKSLSSLVKNTKKRESEKVKIDNNRKCLNFSRKTYLWCNTYGYWGLWVVPSKSPMPTFSFPPNFCLPIWQGLPSPRVMNQEPSSLIGPLKGCCWTMPLWFLSSSCFCTPSLNWDAGGSEQLERTLEYGIVHQQPLEG